MFSYYCQQVRNIPVVVSFNTIIRIWIVEILGTTSNTILYLGIPSKSKSSTKIMWCNIPESSYTWLRHEIWSKFILMRTQFYWIVSGLVFYFWLYWFDLKSIGPHYGSFTIVRSTLDRNLSNISIFNVDAVLQSWMF